QPPAERVRNRPAVGREGRVVGTRSVDRLGLVVAGAAREDRLRPAARVEQPERERETAAAVEVVVDGGYLAVAAPIRGVGGRRRAGAGDKRGERGGRSR